MPNVQAASLLSNTEFAPLDIYGVEAVARKEETINEYDWNC